MESVSSRRARGPVALSFVIVSGLASCSGARVETLASERAPEVFGAGREGTRAQTGTESRPAPRSQPRVPTEDVEELVALAYRRSPRLAAAFAGWKAALARIPQAGALPDPMLSLAHFVEEIQTRTGPQRNRLGLTQSFPWFGTLGAREAAAKREAEAAWQRVLAARLEVERQVRRAAFGYGLLRERIRIADEQLALLRQIEPVLLRRIEAGGPASDAVRLQLELGRLESELQALRDQRSSRSRRIERALSIESSEPLPWIRIPAPEFRRLDADALVQQAGRDNPELRALAERIDAGREGVTAAERSGYPSFSVGVDWFDTGDAINPNTPGSGDDPWLVRLGISLPIWRDKYDGMNSEAKSELERRGHDFAAKRDELRLRLSEALFAYHDAQRRAELIEDSLLPRAKEAWKLISADFRGGKKSLLDVIESERALLALETEYWRAVRDWHVQQAELRALAGGELR